MLKKDSNNNKGEDYMKKNKISMILLVLLLVSLALTACNKSNDNLGEGGLNETSDPTLGGKVYRFADSYDVNSLNPHNQEDSLIADINIFTDSMLYRRVPNESGTGDIIIGDIADGDPYLVDDDGYVWQIKLREDATWQNGEPINADTFIYSFKMLLDPDLVNSLASMMYDYYITIVNAKEYFVQNQEGNPEVKWEDVGIKKIDDYTLEIITDQRYTADHVKLHFMLRSQYPVYEDYYEAGMNSSRTSTTYGTSLDNYMGSGPYIFKEWNQDASRIYVKNPDHWLADYFQIDKIEARVVPDSNARVQLFENGEIDILGVESSILEKYQDDPRLKSYLSITPTHIDINSLNTKNPILGTLNFRKALFYGIDRETIGELTSLLPAPYYINHQAGGIPEKGILYRDTPEAKAIVLDNYGYDPELAKQYFEEALKEVNESSVSVEYMLSDTGENSKKIAEYLQESLPKIFGEDKFKLTMRFVPSANFTAMKDWKTDPNSFDIASGGWGASLSRVYPYTAFQYFRSSYSSRPNSYVTERFDNLYEELQTEEVRINSQLMVEKTAELEKIYIEDVINVPVGQSYSYTLFSDRIKLPVKDYVPGFGFGTMFSEIVE